jgi:hypothetical protein
MLGSESSSVYFARIITCGKFDLSLRLEASRGGLNPIQIVASNRANNGRDDRKHLWNGFEVHRKFHFFTRATLEMAGSVTAPMAKGFCLSRRK